MARNVIFISYFIDNLLMFPTVK